MAYVEADGIFPAHDLETMNEDDVAGELVRPFCRAMGYSQGNPAANLRSQITLQYDRVFLGHKNEKTDPKLRGRPDFVCEVVSYGRWVIEAKAPNVDLGQDDSFQAHTYATHPEIAAEHYLLTNGRTFQLYRVGRPEEPIWAWRKSDTADMIDALRAFLGPSAVKGRAAVAIDKGKPLAPGLRSSIEIVGGHVTYVRNIANFVDASHMDRLVNPVTGNRVYRTDEGLITGEVSIKSAFEVMDAIFEASNFYPLRFSSSDEYLSTSRESPTMLQSLFSLTMPRGMSIPKTPFSPAGILPLSVKASAYTEVTGYIDGNRMLGAFAMDCEYDLLGVRLPNLPSQLTLFTEGTFEISIN